MRIFFLKQLFTECSSKFWFPQISSKCSNAFNSIFDYILNLIQYPTTFSYFEDIKTETLETMIHEYFIEYMELISFLLKSTLKFDEFSNLIHKSIDFMKLIENEQDNEHSKKHAFYVTIYLMNALESILQYSKSKMNQELTEKEEDFILKIMNTLLSFNPKIKDGNYSNSLSTFLTNENLSNLYLGYHQKKWETINIFTHILSSKPEIYSKINNFTQFITEEIDCVSGPNSVYVFDTLSILFNTEAFENVEYILNTAFESVIYFDTRFSMPSFIPFASLLLNLNFWKNHSNDMDVLKKMLKKVLNHGKLHPRVSFLIQ
jgi:hypothetical protein